MDFRIVLRVNEMFVVLAKWTGEYPTLCSGTWVLTVNGVDCSHIIPNSLKHSHMNTYQIYETQSFDKNLDVEFTENEDGLKRDEWIAENKYWLDNITTNLNEQIAIFHEFQTEDWRHGTCGGCLI